MKEEILVGDKILVCGELITTVTKCQDGKIYFLNENGAEKWDEGEAIKFIGGIDPYQR